MGDLQISQARSLHPSAQHWLGAPSRICLMGCQDVKQSELRRFPVHDSIRCNHWLRHFGVSDQRVEQLGGLQKLRICFRHFQNMAKTRIKMTPLRKSKAMPPTTTAADTNTTGGGGVEAAAKPIVDNNTTIQLVKIPIRDPQKAQQAKKSVVTITPVPQRSHSICSSASSDVQSISSDYEVALPLAALVESTQNGNGFPENGNVSPKNGIARPENGQPKKRKLYLITEKSNETNGHGAETNGQPKKRKMFVVVEQEKESVGKKLMIVSDKPQDNLTQHLEKLLPQILNRIQDKEQKQVKPPPLAVKEKPLVLRPHITLPPKKNPTNFVKISPDSAPAAVPVAVPLPPLTPCAKIIKSENDQKEQKAIKDEDPTKMMGETNINLSPDFRFLMKILPKLEQLPEPHKQDVKRSIQIFVEKSYSIYGKKNQT
ncbi:uncharacterized protein LOC117589172 isoform X1 [Drosophila guanche]|uniref:THAP-type domain-containing protein n=2 Tax=Drosophila guanche TaxID=7266 RepID=A0A3B0KTG7_DROGU|nr:uncharacterized protein LOC117589172 isoform X1 [Drosophila guanche]SPP87198.1 Hypothetical predicted protein [Drosophila guanche]